MRNSSIQRLGLLCTLFAAFFAAPVFAQVPSLAASDAYYVTAKTEFGNEVFTIIRDGRLEENFYFVPARPHVAIEKRNGKDMPVFQLLSFQRKTADNELKQGGILQLSMQMGISEKTQKELLNTIKNKFPLKDSSKIHRLSPVPMKDARFTMYGLDGSMLDSAPVTEGIAPIFGNQQVPFMLNLSALGSDVMAALCTGGGGLPVIVTFSFQGMTPPGGFKVEVDWDMSYKHLSTDTKLRANVACANLGADLGADFTKIRNEMISNGMMKITSLTSEALSEEALNNAMNPVIELITRELFEGIKAPEMIEPASAKEIAAPVSPKDEPKEAGKVTPAAPAAPAADAAKDAVSGLASTAGAAVPYVGTLMKALDAVSGLAKTSKVNVGASFALKDVKLTKKGKLVYVYDRQAIVERKTSFGGPIGIGSFDKKIQDQCITVLPDGRWESAYYTLPAVGDSTQLGFKEISIEVSPVCENKPVAGQKIMTAFFKAKDGFWTDKTGEAISLFLFPLKAVYDSAEYKADPNKFKFSTKTTVTSDSGPQVVVTSETPMFDGDVAMTPPSELLQPVMLSADCLTLGTGDDEIFKIQGILKADNKSFPIKLDANKTSQGYLVPTNTKSLKISNLKFMTKKGKIYNWANNDKELKEISPELDLSFFDYDWQGTADSDSIMGQPVASKN